MLVSRTNRRAFIAGLGSAAAWPVVVLGQQAMPVVGFLSGSSLDDMKPAVAAFTQELKEAGYIEGVSSTDRCNIF